jgi:hypothetical protein
MNNDGRMDLFSLGWRFAHQRRQMILDTTSAGDGFQAGSAAIRATLCTCDRTTTLEVPPLAGVCPPRLDVIAQFADFDNDGWVDLFIASGMSRDTSTPVLRADAARPSCGRGMPSVRNELVRSAAPALRGVGPLGAGSSLGQLRGGGRRSRPQRHGSGRRTHQRVALYRNDSQSGHRV